MHIVGGDLAIFRSPPHFGSVIVNKRTFDNGSKNREQRDRNHRRNILFNGPHR